MSFRMGPIYPHRVSNSSAGDVMREANSNAGKAEPARKEPASACCGGHGPAGHDHGSGSHHAHDVTTVRDPVCGMTVNTATSKHRFDYRGETYHFCSAGCRTKF